VYICMNRGNRLLNFRPRYWTPFSPISSQSSPFRLVSFSALDLSGSHVLTRIESSVHSTEPGCSRSHFEAIPPSRSTISLLATTPARKLVQLAESDVSCTKSGIQRWSSWSTGGIARWHRGVRQVPQLNGGSLPSCRSSRIP
jgi:hypothetical protein